jgi:hypothetical protein
MNLNRKVKRIREISAGFFQGEKLSTSKYYENPHYEGWSSRVSLWLGKEIRTQTAAAPKFLTTVIQKIITVIHLSVFHKIKHVV